MQITKQQLERLRQNDSILYHGVLPGLSRSYGSSKDGPFTLDLSKVKEAFRNVFPEWAKKNIVEQPASDPELDAVTNPDPTPVAPVQPAVTKQTLDAADRNLKDLQEAEARFRYWLSQGLLDTPENTLLIESWLANQAGDHYSAGGIDSCIEANRAALMSAPKRFGCHLELVCRTNILCGNCRIWTAANARHRVRLKEQRTRSWQRHSNKFPRVLPWT